MKISPRDVKLVVFSFLSHPAIILIPAVIAFSTGSTQAIMGGTGGNGTSYNTYGIHSDIVQIRGISLS